MKEQTETILALMFAFALLGLFFWLGYMYAQDKFEVENKNIDGEKVHNLNEDLVFYYSEDEEVREINQRSKK